MRFAVFALTFLAYSAWSIAGPPLCEVELTSAASETAEKLLQERIFNRPFLYNVSSFDAKGQAFDRLGLPRLHLIDTRSLVLFVIPDGPAGKLKLVLGLLRPAGWHRLQSPAVEHELGKMVVWLPRGKTAAGRPWLEVVREQMLTREFLDRRVSEMQFAYTAANYRGGARPYLSFEQEGLMDGTHIVLGLNIPCRDWHHYSAGKVTEAQRVRTDSAELCRLPVVFFSAPAIIDQD